jgi:hypothetical protein
LYCSPCGLLVVVVVVVAVVVVEASEICLFVCVEISCYARYSSSIITQVHVHYFLSKFPFILHLYFQLHLKVPAMLHITTYTQIGTCGQEKRSAMMKKSSNQPVTVSVYQVLPKFTYPFCGIKKRT